MSVDELLRTYASSVPALDPDAPLRSVHHRVRRRRLVRRGIAATAVVLALVAASAAAVRPHHDARVTSNETGQAVTLDLPAGYAEASDRRVAPDSPLAGVDGNVLVLYTGADDRSVLVVSRPHPFGAVDRRFTTNATVQGVPAAVYTLAQPGRVWIPDLHGLEITVDAQGLTTEADLRALADSLREQDGHAVLGDYPIWADRVLTDGPHPVDVGEQTRRQVVFRSAGRHLVLDVTSGRSSTVVARWRDGGRAVDGLGDGDATYLERDGERRVGWEQGEQSFALRTDDPAIGDDELVAIARSVRVSG
jgi:hypothetical protein